VKLDGGGQELVQFESRDEAEAALDTLMKQIDGLAGTVTIRGRGTLMVDTSDVKTASVYESA